MVDSYNIRRIIVKVGADGVETIIFRFFINDILIMSAYLIPYLSSFPKIMLSGIGIAGLGCIANITWSVCGDKMQNIFKKYYRQINLVLGIFLLYCAVKILIG